MGYIFEVNTLFDVLSFTSHGNLNQVTNTFLTIRNCSEHMSLVGCQKKVAPFSYGKVRQLRLNTNDWKTICFCCYFVILTYYDLNKREMDNKHVYNEMHILLSKYNKWKGS